MAGNRLGASILALLLSATAPALAETIVALMSDNTLRHFDSGLPGTFTKTVALSGIPAAEAVAALDFRPDGSLVVVTRQNLTLRFYFVNPNTGAAVGSNFEIDRTSINAVAFDSYPPGIHPNVDMVVATDDDRMIPFFIAPGVTGGDGTRTLVYDNSTADGDPADEHASANPSIVALATTNSFPGGQAHVFYGIDSLQNSLVRIDYQTGVIDTIGTLRTNPATVLQINSRTGLDISGATGMAYLMFGSGDTTLLVRVDLTTGSVANVGQIGPAPQAGGPTPVDISVLAPTQLSNISTRSRVGTGQDVMIAGFIIQGGASTRAIIRGLGPSLSALGVNGPLADPVLTVFDGNGVQIATNDNWKSSQQAEISGTGVAPSNDLEAAFVGLFPPGAYTAIISGKNNGTGVSVVEVFRLPELTF
ncbi:MAG TPA: DUF4394 domain-containing protein [Chthoniobacterales bacterium]|jgi:hypothetical protein|nr:DUF4394 domain-containing protein [Chthoniobacterales bacterium]